MFNIEDMKFLSISALAGVASHFCYFIHGEHHLRGPQYVKHAAEALIAMIALQAMIDYAEVPHVTKQVLCLEAAYALGVFSSILVYRLFFHPLRHFPGPRLLKITKLGHPLMSRRFDNCIQIHRLREKYGDIVRTGPNELTFFTFEAFNAIYGPRSKCSRGESYDMHMPRSSVTGTRDLATHATRRRVWDHAFSTKGGTPAFTFVRARVGFTYGGMGANMNESDIAVRASRPDSRQPARTPPF